MQPMSGAYGRSIHDNGLPSEGAIANLSLIHGDRPLDERVADYFEVCVFISFSQAP